MNSRRLKARRYLRLKYRTHCKRWISLSSKVSEDRYVSTNLPHVLLYDSWEDKLKALEIDDKIGTLYQKKGNQ